MKAYLLSLFFHLFFAGLLFFLAAAPGKALPPVKINQVFLVAEVPTAFVSVEARFIAPAVQAPPSRRAEEMNPTPAIKLKEEIEPTPIKPEVSLAEKLATRLGSAAPEVWNPTTVTRPEKPRETPVTPTETKPEISAKEELSAGQGSPARVESEPGFSDSWYLALLDRRLTERWNPAREGIAVVKREVSVSFTITRDGRIKDVVLVRASGNLRFDRSGLTAVIESDFLPPLPASWGKKELQVSVRFREK